jgi:hypothetical protein
MERKTTIQRRRRRIYSPISINFIAAILFTFNDNVTNYRSMIIIQQP